MGDGKFGAGMGGGGGGVTSPCPDIEEYQYGCFKNCSIRSHYHSCNYICYNNEAPAVRILS